MAPRAGRQHRCTFASLCMVVGSAAAFLFQQQPPALRLSRPGPALGSVTARARMSSGRPSPRMAAGAPAPSSTAERALAKNTAIVGAGPAGLFASLVLARRGYSNIVVFDRLPRPPEPSSAEWGNPLRSYNLGLGARGQIALTEAEVWPSIAPFCAQAVGRKDWTPETGERPVAIYTDREYKTQVIQRDRLASCILTDVEKKHGAQVRVLHNVDCVGVSYPEDGSVELTLQQQGGATPFSQRFDWVVGADGVRSAIRGEAEARTQGSKRKSESVRSVKLPERNEFVYRTLPLDLRPRYGTGPGWRPDLNYSARIKEEVTIEALPTKEGVYIGVVLFRPDSPLIAAIKSKEDAKAFFAKHFPQFVELLREEDLEAFATGPTFRLPTFSYAGPAVHFRNNTVLMGDCLHAVKPYYGLGAVSALQDAIELDRCLDATNDDLNKALPLYSKKRGPEAKALVEFQAGFDYDAKTKEGFLRFILPLILDGVFHRLAPRVFAPNGIRLLQDHRYSYTAVRDRKRRDRALQALVIGTVVAGVGRVALWGVKTAVRLVVKA